MSGPEQTPEESGKNQDALGACVEYWQSRLANAEDHEIGRIASEATKACDELWKYDGVYCTFSGQAVYPEVDDNGGITISAGEIMADGYSRGFVVEDFTGNGDYRLFHMFYLGPHQSKPHPTIFNQASLFAYMGVDGEIIPHYEMEEALMPQKDPFAIEQVDVQERMEAIDNQSLKLVRLLHSRQFRKQAVDKQVAILDGFVSKCEQKYDLRDLAVMVENPAYCCRPYLLPTDEVKYEFIALNDTLINGTFLGLGTLERETLKRKPIRRTEDLINKAAGLCMIVEVSDASEPTALRSDDIIYIPTADQDMDASFYMQSTPQRLDPLPLGGSSSEGGPDELVG